MCMLREAREVSGSLEPELQVVVNDPIWDLCLGPLKEQQRLLTCLSSRQPYKLVFFKYFYLLTVFYIHLM